MNASTTKAVFLDKDGTLVVNVPYNTDPAKVELTPGAIDGLRKLNRAGYRLIVVSNQSGIGHGYFAIEQLLGCMNRLYEILQSYGIEIDGFYYCPHHPQAELQDFRTICECRKPQAGMILQAAREHYCDLSQCWFIGDILDDVEAGHRAGCRAILIDAGNETVWNMSGIRAPDYRATDLDEAADIILRALADIPDGFRTETGKGSSSHRTGKGWVGATGRNPVIKET